MKKSYWPTYRINSRLVDLLVGSSLMSRGIHDRRSYFKVMSGLIVVWVIVCAFIGALLGGFGGVLWGVLAGMIMPLLMVYLSIIAPMILAQMAGLVLGLLWILFVVWIFLSILFH